MSLVYYQLCRETGRFVKKDETSQPPVASKGKFNKTLHTRGSTPKKSETTFTGVSFCPRTLRWRAYITVNGVLRSLGMHPDDKSAAIAYDKEAIKVGRKTNILQPCR